ncbi:MAG: patatin-like phospholipase family protein [Firmicutes bacterium]|nr:patatin-like phospholipase family protein [Bacillota bacterium]
MKFIEKVKSGLSLEKNKKVKIGLALGGGGARGYAHLGAIKAFEEYGIKFDFIAGTSAGAFTGAFLASGWSFEQMYSIAKEFRRKDIRRNKIPFMPSTTEGIQEIVVNNLGDIDITETKIPFCAVAVDVLSTQECLITKGNLAKAVAGSCAVPGIFQPVEFEGRALADGGLQNTLPSNVPKLFGCDYVIAVDVNAKRTYGASSTKILDVMGATIRILMKRNAEKGYEYADVVLTPETKRFKSTSLEGFDDMIEEGYLEAIDKMPQILEILNKKPISNRLKSKYKDEAVVI